MRQVRKKLRKYGMLDKEEGRRGENKNKKGIVSVNIRFGIATNLN